MIPEREWLDKAKQLAVGMQIRTWHGREKRANLVIGNERGYWWCYCQRCKEGAKVQKEHILLKQTLPPPETEFKVPDDLAPVIGSPYEASIGHFLASKGMMYPYVPKLWYSPRTARLCLQDDTGGWHGRDVTGRSNAKWLHYSKPVIVGTPGAYTVLVEDIFSMYKIKFAVRGTDIAVVSTLGAGCSAAAALALKNCTTLVWAYDADKAGDAGFKQGRKRMQLLVPKQVRARPPEGLDPKDMDCTNIRALLEEALKCET